MILLADNDILVKLAQCDLMGEALDIFGVNNSDCYVLDTAKYALYLNDPDKCIGRRLGTAHAYERLCSFIGECSELGAARDDVDLIEELMLVESLDAGELALVLHANQLDQIGNFHGFATGDKRALRGIAESECHAVKALLTEKVDCLESVLLKAVNRYGHASIRQKVEQALQVTDPAKFDTVLRMSFGNGRDELHCTECLKHYMQPVVQFIKP